MRKTAWLIFALVLLAATAWGEKIPAGLGAYGGLDIPIVQDDQEQGMTFGFKGRITLLPPLTFEPNVNFASYGDPDIENVIGDPDGAKVTSFGLDAVIGTPLGGEGPSVFAFAGFGFYTFKIDQLDVDESKLGFSGGLGFELGLSPTFGLEARGRFVVIPTDGGGSRKSAALTAGINYHFGL